MKILILNSILFTAEKNVIPKVKSIKDTLAYNMCLGFVNLGHEVTLVAAEEYKPVEEDYDFNILFFKTQLKSLFLPSVFPLSLGLYPFLKKNAKDFDLIISGEVFSFSSFFISLIAPQKTVIYQELGLHNKKMKRIPSIIWYNVIARFFMQKSLVIPKSCVAQDFISCYHKNVSSEIITHGINFAKMKYSTEKSDYFITIGRLVPGKNIESIIINFEDFLKKYNLNHYKLYIAGSGELDEYLKHFVEQRNLVNNVIFLGNLQHSELNTYLSHAKAILLNSKKELCMVSLYEAVVVATPVITNTVPYNSIEVIQNKLGIAKDDWNENDMMEVIQNNQFYIDNCLFYRKHLSIETIANKFIDIFSKRKDYF